MSGRSGFLLDASALLNIITELDFESLSKNNLDLFITQLTPFEIGNALWKLTFRRIISEKKAKIIMSLLEQVLDLNLIRIIQTTKYDDTLNISLRRKITFYDASYITVAKNHGLVLVTDDKGLRVNAKIENIEAITSVEFKKQHQEIIKKK